MEKQLANREHLLVMRNKDWIWVPENVAVAIASVLGRGEKKVVKIAPERFINTADLTEFMGPEDAAGFIEQQGYRRCSSGKLHKHDEKCYCHDGVGISSVAEVFTIDESGLERVREVKNQIRKKFGWPQVNYESGELNN